MSESAEQESIRIAALKSYDILDTPPDGAFDRVTALAARIFNTPDALSDPRALAESNSVSGGHA